MVTLKLLVNMLCTPLVDWYRSGIYRNGNLPNNIAKTLDFFFAERFVNELEK